MVYKNFKIKSKLTEDNLTRFPKRSTRIRPGIFHITPEEDFGILKSGTKEQLKEWFWRELMKGHVSGYELISDEEYQKDVAAEQEFEKRLRMGHDVGGSNDIGGPNDYAYGM
jgi:hypothetical protein